MTSRPGTPESGHVNMGSDFAAGSPEPPEQQIYQTAPPRRSPCSSVVIDQAPESIRDHRVFALLQVREQEQVGRGLQPPGEVLLIAAPPIIRGPRLWFPPATAFIIHSEVLL